MMTEFDICQMYRQAKDKREQIKILAELNATYPSRIIKILSKNGEFRKTGGKDSGWRKGAQAESLRHN